MWKDLVGIDTFEELSRRVSTADLILHSDPEAAKRAWFFSLVGFLLFFTLFVFARHTVDGSSVSTSEVSILLAVYVLLLLSGVLVSYVLQMASMSEADAISVVDRCILVTIVALVALSADFFFRNQIFGAVEGTSCWLVERMAESCGRGVPLEFHRVIISSIYILIGLLVPVFNTYRKSRSKLISLSGAVYRGAILVSIVILVFGTLVLRALLFSPELINWS